MEQFEVAEHWFSLGNRIGGFIIASIVIGALAYAFLKGK